MHDDIGDEPADPGKPMLGRGDELDRLIEMLDEPGRLVTITGPGGQGKTRLAIAAVEVFSERLTDGARFVSLAGVADPADLVQAIAAALRIGGASRGTGADGLVAALADRDVLVVLDNFEQLVPATEVVDELISSCPRLRVLVTSRVPLSSRKEVCLELGPLPMPEPHQPDDDALVASAVEGVAALGSVQLFCARAGAVDPRFALTADNVGAVIDICRLVGGSPLAIELAAARLALLSPAELAAGLRARPLTVLSDTGRTRPVRQRSIRSTIEWSHDLLDAAEQQLLCLLSVAESDLSLETVEAIVGDRAVDLLDRLGALVDSHLVEPIRTSTGEPRFVLPTPVRDFARERLDGGRDAAPVRERLVAHMVGFGTEAGRGLESESELAWLDRVDLELDQLRATLTTLRATDDDAALRLAVSLAPYWLHRGLLAEGRRHLAPALRDELAATVDPALVALAAAWEARLAADQGVVADHLEAGSMVDRLRRGLASARADGDVHDELRALDFLSHVLVLHSGVEEATAVTEEGITTARRAGHAWWLSQLLQRSAVFARLRDDLDSATEQAAEALVLARMLRDDRLVLHVGLTIVQLPPSTAVDDPPTLADLVALADRVGDRRMACVVRTSVAIEAMFAGELAEAASVLRQVLRLAQDTAYWHAIGFGLMTATAYAATVGDHRTCARLHGATAAEINVLRQGMPPAYHAVYEELVAATRATAGDDDFDRWAAQAAPLGWAHATTLARDFLLAHESPAEHVSARPAADGPRPLTAREREVLAAIASGDTNKDVARRLRITPKTVMHHTSSIYRKLGVRGRAEATALALRDGLLDDPAIGSP